MEHEGILLVNKPAGKTSFSLVQAVRKKLGVKKVGHAGTLDPFATGLMVLLVGRRFTKLSNTFLETDKEYRATIHLGIRTDSFDCDGKILATSDSIPKEEEIQEAIALFQGDIEQTPPMFSAKKIGGKKLYELARRGEVVERSPVRVHIEIELLHYSYPLLQLHVRCSKGTYIRALADDMGMQLGCGAHLSRLTRTKSGPYRLDDAIHGDLLFQRETALDPDLLLDQA